MVNTTPSVTVYRRDSTEILYKPVSIAWWHHVTEIPEDTRIIVLRKGIPIGSKQLIPIGGHEFPSSMAGDSARCKYVQNIPKKKKHSEKMNKIIPSLKPSNTSVLWEPS